jgi:hypothetical protein
MEQEKIETEIRTEDDQGNNERQPDKGAEACGGLGSSNSRISLRPDVAESKVAYDVPSGSFVSKERESREPEYDSRNLEA